MENITKVSEDLLVEVLNTLPESHPMYDLIDAELDRRADEYTKVQASRQEAEIKRLQLTHFIETSISELFHGMKEGRKMVVLVSKLGQAYMDDYEICQDTFKVTSLVAKYSNYDVPSAWQFKSIEDANAKKVQLIYYRVYNEYMRNPTIESLQYLEKVLFGR